MLTSERKAMSNSTVNDSEIVGLLFERDEKALIYLSDKYSALYTSIIRGTLDDECDVQECVDDLLLDVWNTIPPNRPQNLMAYVAKLARRVGIDRFRHNMRQKRNPSHTVMLSELEESIGALPSASERDEGEIANTLNLFLATLDAKTRVIFIRRYVYFESVSSIAERFNMSENAVSVSLHRTRSKLKKSLKKEGLDI